MFRLMMLLAGIGGLLPSIPGSQNSFLQIIFPEEIKGNTSSEEQKSYIIPIDEKPYTVHLNKRNFLANRFMVYLYSQGSVSPHSSDIPAQCYYQGYFEGHPNSVVMLSTCSGLRGILQLENASYGIEPLESAVIFQHILYKLGNENMEFAFLNKNSRSIEKDPMDYSIFISEKPELPSPGLFPLYLEMNIVVDKALYDYLGSDSMIVTKKVIEIISLVNSVFTQFKVTIVLSSLELWSDKNKISTDGEEDELLQKFLEWKQSYLTLRPHDVAYLFLYKDHPNYMGATFSGKMCVSRYSAGIAVYTKNITLETFSVIVTQMLGLSLGISYDDPMKCQCSEAICIMNPGAMQSSGMKTFSNCSLSDFESFISSVGAKCLQNKPQMQGAPASVCGNRVVEGDEICDCGTEEECGPLSCCDSQRCVLKAGKDCDDASNGTLCCKSCKFLEKGKECRPARHPECDLAEYCNGSSAHCPRDITMLSGNLCKNNKFVCYDGMCHDLDEACEKTFGKGSKNAPFACYEEIQGQTDRFGNCGKDRGGRYIFCGWRNLLCGRLICTYPKRVPFKSPNNATSVIYAYVRDNLCITAEFAGSPDDPLLRLSGPNCDSGRICIDAICTESRHIKNSSAECARMCSGHGVCNSEVECHCDEGYQPPYCQTSSARSSILPGKNGLIMERDSGRAKKWLLSLYVGLPVLIIATIIVVTWNGLKKWFTKEEESLSSKSISEGSTHTYVSRSRSEGNSQTDAGKSTSEGSTQAHTSRSKSQGSIKTQSSSN